MKKKICYVIGAGENYGLDFHPEPDDYVVAADGGGICVCVCECVCVCVCVCVQFNALVSLV